MDDSVTLHIVMLQEPLSWILHHLATERGSMSNSGDISQSTHTSHSKTYLMTESSDDNLMKKFGEEYLQFLDIEKSGRGLVKSAISIFHFHLQKAHAESGNMQQQYSNRNKTQLMKNSVIGKDLVQNGKQDRSSVVSPVSVLIHLESLLLRPNTLVLTKEHIEGSLQILDNVFDTGDSYFYSSLSTCIPLLSKSASNSGKINWIGDEVIGSPLAMKNSANYLQLHSMLYQASLKHFYQQYFYLSIQS
jgi:hypothetical protein